MDRVQSEGRELLAAPMRVAWRRPGDELTLTVHTPEGVSWRVESKASWRGIMRVAVSGEERPDLVPRPARAQRHGLAPAH